MPRTRIKICGIRDIESAEAAIDAGVDAVGLVFVEKSPRLITADEAEKVVAYLPAFVDPIALFVDASSDYIRNVCGHLGVRTIQLHGHESPQFAEALTDFNIIKALAFEVGQVQDALTPWVETTANVVGLLWDTPPSQEASADSMTGGSGKAFDWNALAAMRSAGALNDCPSTILAGGLNATNVAEAIATVQPFAVDVSSGVESQRGVKDPALIAAFCDAVREADARYVMAS